MVSARRADPVEEYRLLHAAADAAVEPWALLKAVRDPGGRIVDFVYHDINRVAARQQRLQRDDLLGRSVAETLPEVARIGLIEQYAHCVDTGEPLIVDDLDYYGRTLDGPERETHRYELRGVRVETDYLSLTWRDVNQRFRDSEHVLAAQTLLRATVDSMLDPQMLLEGVRDSAGRVVDLRYREANAAACKDMAITRDELIGRTVLELLPGFAESGPLSYYAQCLETGQPGELNDYSYDHEIQASSRRYDIRIAPAGPNLISLTFRDVTERFQSTERIAVSEEKYRLLAMNSTDVIIHGRNGKVVWASPSVTDVLGGSPDYWIGRPLKEVVPADQEADFDARQEVLAEDRAVQSRTQLVALDGTRHWIHVHSKPFYDLEGRRDGFTASLRVIDDEVAAEQAVDQARREQVRADALYRRSVDSAAVGMCLADLEGNFLEVNKALCEFFGYDADSLQQKTWQELTDPDYLEADLDNRAQVLAGVSESYRMVKKFIHAEGHPIWGDLAVSCIRDHDGHVEIFIGQIADITAEVQAREQLEQARREKQRDDERYRRSIDNAAVGMCMVTLDGRVTQVNQALCRFLGLEAEAAIGTHWQDVTAPEYLEEEQNNWNDLVEGRIDSYRMVKHYRHADGHVVWGDLSVSAIRDDDGKLEHVVALITDVTAEIQAREGLIASEERNRVLAEGLQSELDSAARYVQSVLPGDLAGQVSVSTRYLPSNTLGGDCFDFFWIDDDHLIVYLLDVSGHGVESALIAVSVHNMLRSASFSTETLLEPDRVLTALNDHFAMERHDLNYFTIFYGVYQPSTGTLRYGNAGHPPALLFTGGQVSELSSQSPPVGTFDDTEFSTTTVAVPSGSQILAYSDGAYELSLEGGGRWSFTDFVGVCTRLAGSPDWVLDELIEILRQRSAKSNFDDDCCLLRLTFN